MRVRESLLFAALGLAGCGLQPKVIDARWGEDPLQVASRLRVACRPWRPWRAPGPFEICEGDPPVKVAALGGTARLEMIRNGGKLRGLTFAFEDCDAKREMLTAAVRREWGTPSADRFDPYEISADDSLFYFHRQDCTLTLAAPDFGRAFAADLLQKPTGIVIVR